MDCPLPVLGAYERGTGEGGGGKRDSNDYAPGDRGIPPEVLVAAEEAGVHEVYRVGGAQGIAALPMAPMPYRRWIDNRSGNIYVALAKKLVFGNVGIDMIAGPSEVLIIADEGANPAFAAADMLAQAEHDAMASCILIATAKGLSGRWKRNQRQLDNLPRRETAQQAFRTTVPLYWLRT